MLLVALAINNIQRQFPVYWWTPLDVGKREVRDEETMPDARGGVEKKLTPEDIEESRETIHVSAHNIAMPADLSLNEEEVEVLQRLKDRLRKKFDEDLGRIDSESSSPSIRSNTAITVPSRGGAGERSDGSTSALYS